MKKKIVIAFGIVIFVVASFVLMLLFKPMSKDPTYDHVAKGRQEVFVSEFTSPNLAKALEYDLGEFTIELKNQKNCFFKVTLSLLCEKKKEEDGMKILKSNEIKIKQFITSFLSEQSSEKLKTFQTEQNLEIEMVNRINKSLKQYLVLAIIRKNSALDCK